MAAADPWARLKEEATCSICRELYTDPVTLACGHNFCLYCFSTFKSKEDLEKACPECKQRFDQEKEMKPNKRLANMVEMVKEMQIAPGSLCEEHGERLQLFCETDGELLCVFCRETPAHREHRVTLVMKAEQEYKGKLQDWLCPLRKEVEYILESKHKEEEPYNIMRNKMRAEKRKIVTEIERLRQILRDEEKTLYERLEKMEKKLNMVENANINKLSNKIASLQALITDIEKRCKESALDLLKDVRSTLSRCTEVTFQCPELERKEKETNIQFVKTPKPEEKIKKYEGLALRLLLVGDHGAGKSSTGNCLLGREEFESQDSRWFGTRECRRGEGHWGGRPLVLVDTPGLRSPLFTSVHLSPDLQRCVQLSAPGPHALLLVLPLGRFTWGGRAAAQAIPSVFGPEALQFMVIVFTGPGELPRETIDTFLRDSGSEGLNALLWRCGGRVCVFNIRATRAERKQQLRGLMRVIDKMVEGNGGRCLRLGQDRPFKAL